MTGWVPLRAHRRHVRCGLEPPAGAWLLDAYGRRAALPGRMAYAFERSMGGQDG